MTIADEHSYQVQIGSKLIPEYPVSSVFDFIGWIFIGRSLLKHYILANNWRFIGMHSFKQYLYWYEFAQILTNEAPTSKGTTPYKRCERLRRSVCGRMPSWFTLCLSLRICVTAVLHAHSFWIHDCWSKLMAIFRAKYRHVNLWWTTTQAVTNGKHTMHVQVPEDILFRYALSRTQTPESQCAKS